MGVSKQSSIVLKWFNDNDFLQEKIILNNVILHRYNLQRNYSVELWDIPIVNLRV
jgi:hypothetical protein